MNASQPFLGTPPKRGHILRRGLSRLLGSLQPGQATQLTDIDPRNASRVILNTARRIGIKVTTRKTSGTGFTVYRLQ